MKATERTSRTPMIAGNWKMNMDYVQGIALFQKLAWILEDAKHDFSRSETVVFPPYTDLRSIQTLVLGDRLKITYGAQDLSVRDAGACTGDISGAFLAKLSCRYVLVGHSERRVQHHESDETVRCKVQAAYRHGLVPVLCIGEPLAEREQGHHFDYVLQQLIHGIQDLAEEEIARLVVAYEPVWAIGTGKVAGSGEAQSMSRVLRDGVAARYGQEVAEGLRILYGGSVTSANASDFFEQSDVDGVLVGGASLDASEFARIVRLASHMGTV